MNRFRESKKGFTLIELIIVVAILVILTAVAVPNYMRLMEKAQSAVEVAAAAEVVNAVNIYNTLVKTGEVATPAITTVPITEDHINHLRSANLWPSFEADQANVLARVGMADGFATVADRD